MTIIQREGGASHPLSVSELRNMWIAVLCGGGKVFAAGESAEFSLVCFARRVSDVLDSLRKAIPLRFIARQSKSLNLW